MHVLAVVYVILGQSLYFILGLWNSPNEMDTWHGFNLFLGYQFIEMDAWRWIGRLIFFVFRLLEWMPDKNLTLFLDYWHFEIDTSQSFNLFQSSFLIEMDIR